MNHVCKVQVLERNFKEPLRRTAVHKSRATKRLLLRCSSAGVVSNHASEAQAPRDKQQVHAICFCASCSTVLC